MRRSNFSGRGQWGGGGRGGNYSNHNRFQQRGGGGRFRQGGRFGGRGRGRGRHNHHRNNNNNKDVPIRYNPAAFDPIEEIGAVSNNNDPRIRIAVEGCCHGELDLIYERLLDHERTTKDTKGKIDLLVCCGDFQSLRNPSDYHSSSIPPKYRRLGNFCNYYDGSKTAPYLTIFIGGNHEASQPLRELYYGGWVAPNIYYLGAAGVVTYRGIKIGGISGIYKSFDYQLGHFEQVPYDRQSVKSVYHVRSVDVERMKLLSNTQQKQKQPLDLVVSHDWPLGIERFGDTKRLIKQKPFFKQEIDRNDLGSPPNRWLLDLLQPKHWCSAHLHVKFHAQVVHHHDRNDQTAPAAASEPRTLPQKSPTKPTSSLLTPSQASKKKNHVNTKNTTKKNGELRNQQADALQALFEGAAAANEETSQEETEATAAATPTNNAIATQAAATTQFHGLETDKSKCIPSIDDIEIAQDMTPIQDLTEQMTKFLALDKCLPRRQFLSVINFEIPKKTVNNNETTDTDKNDASGENNDTRSNDAAATTTASAAGDDIPTANKEEESPDSDKEHQRQEEKQYHLEYDPEWLAILKTTHDWNNIQRRPTFGNHNPPQLPPESQRYDSDWVKQRFREYYKNKNNKEANKPNKQNCLEIPRDFVPTVPYHTDVAFATTRSSPPLLPAMGNPQTDRLLEILQMDHILTQPYDPQLTPQAISERLRGLGSGSSANGAFRGAAAAGTNHHNSYRHQPIRVLPNDAAAPDDNEIDLEEDGDEEDEGVNDTAVVVAEAAVDDNEIDLEEDGSSSSDGVNNADNNKAVAEAANEEDCNEIDIDESSDEGSDVIAVVKKARIED